MESGTPIPRKYAEAFSWAVGAFPDWAASIPERAFGFGDGTFATMSEICGLVEPFTDPLPEINLTMLDRATHDSEVDRVPLFHDPTYRGGGKHLLRLIEAKRVRFEQLEARRRDRQ
jgi:hypothetical protein